MSGERAKPFLTLHMGQAGTQIGHAIWELLCLEHNILPNGKAKPECSGNGFYNAMFIKSASGHFMPRTVFMDTDPTCLDEIRVGPYRDMFSSNQLVSDHFDAGCNYMRGRNEFNNRLVPDVVDQFRWLMEKTDTTPTTFLVHGVSGGTGSGVAVSCLESLSNEFGSSLRILELNVSSGRSGLQNSFELINQVMYQFESRDFTNLSFSFTNSAMFNVCRSGLNMTNATYAHVNRMLAMFFSNLTSMERFPGIVTCNVDSIVNNVLPFKHLKHPIVACAPFCATDSMSKERVSPLGAASAVVEQDSQLTDIDLRQGKHMAGVLIFRGGVKPSDVDQAMASLRSKSRMEFIEWAPSGFKTGLIELPPFAVPSSGIGSTALSVTMISNHTAVAALFRGHSESIKKLSTGNYFLHNYEAATSGGTTSGHNSDVRNLLKEACNYMDSVASVYESEQPPAVLDDMTARPRSSTQLETQSLDRKPSGFPADQPSGGATGEPPMHKSLVKHPDGAPTHDGATPTRNSWPGSIGSITTPHAGNATTSGADPSDADPSGADPSGADPSGADPAGADPSGADPSGADPSGTDPVEVATDSSRKTSGCCRKKRQQPPPARATGGAARAQSQNNAMPFVRLEGESLRSSTSSDHLAVTTGGHRSRNSGHNVASRHRGLREESTASTRSVDSSVELNDIIQSCLPPGSALLDSTITSVKQIIEKYNQLFAKDGRGAAAGRRR